MKKFLIKTSLFVFIPIIIGIATEFLLPFAFFTRPYEGLAFDTNIPRNSERWYPNVQLSATSEGDLCHHTPKAVLKIETWITDKAGFRNDIFVEDPDILFIGDSFFAGACLKQNELVSNMVKAKLQNNTKVYCMAPSSFNAFDRFLKTAKLKKPKLVIFSGVERLVPTALVPFFPTQASKIKDAVKDLCGVANANIYYDKAFRGYAVNWIRAGIHNIVGQGIPAVGKDDLFFLQGAAQAHQESDLNDEVKAIVSYKKYCDALGIHFLFIPMPDKESVYYEYVPFKKQPDYLFRLDSILNANGVSTINTLAIYNQYRATHSSLLYQLDDTHWNSNASNLVSDEIIKYLSQTPL